MIASSVLALVLAAAPAPAALVSPAPDADHVVGRGCTPFWTLVEGGKAAPGAPLCDPAHEKLTIAALVRVRELPAGATCATPAAAEILEGVRWADDPEGELAKGTWAAHFGAFEKQAAKGATFGPTAPLLARVHFGDLEAVHAMSAVYGASPWDAYHEVIRWAEFEYRVALGDIAGTTRLGDVPVEGFPKLFPKQKPTTVNALFGVTEKAGDVKKRALGALLHLVEDAFTPSHVRRANLDEGLLGGVVAYGSNEKAASEHHKSDHGWRELWKDDGALSAVEGANDLLQRAADVTMLVAGKRDWASAKRYFDAQVFSIAGGVPRPASAKAQR